MALHDWKCLSCGYVSENVLIKPTNGCDSCGSDMEITFQNWKNFNRNREFLSDNDSTRVDDKGFVRKFSVADDRYAQIQLGINLNQSDVGLKTFTDDQSMYYTGRLLRDGDSPKLRREILDETKKSQEQCNADFQ